MGYDHGIPVEPMGFLGLGIEPKCVIEDGKDSVKTKTLTIFYTVYILLDKVSFNMKS